MPTIPLAPATPSMLVSAMAFVTALSHASNGWPLTVSARSAALHGLGEDKPDVHNADFV